MGWWSVLLLALLLAVPTAGQRGDSRQFQAVLNGIRVLRPGPGPRTRPDRVSADKAYSSKTNTVTIAAIDEWLSPMKRTLARPTMIRPWSQRTSPVSPMRSGPLRYALYHPATALAGLPAAASVLFWLRGWQLGVDNAVYRSGAWAVLHDERPIYPPSPASTTALAAAGSRSRSVRCCGMHRTRDWGQVGSGR
jgi:hypothetical protein